MKYYECSGKKMEEIVKWWHLRTTEAKNLFFSLFCSIQHFSISFRINKNFCFLFFELNNPEKLKSVQHTHIFLQFPALVRATAYYTDVFKYYAMHKSLEKLISQVISLKFK